MTFHREDVTDALQRVTANAGPHRYFVLIENMRRIIRLIDESDLDDDEDGKMAMIAVTSMMTGIDLERDRQRKA